METGRQATLCSKDALSSGILKTAVLVPGFLAEDLSGSWLNSDPLLPASLTLSSIKVTSKSETLETPCQGTSEFS